MCGISCILALHGHMSKHACTGHAQATSSEIEGLQSNDCPRHDAIAHELNASLDQIKHRGPDSRGQWLSSDNRVGPLEPA